MRALRVAPNVRLVIGRGTTADYRRLARFHYRAGTPGLPWLVLVARRPTGEPVGVLVASYPALNGWWRQAAWPSRFGCHISRLNREVRVISRVIVDPRWRGLGVASGLVRHYLRHHATAKTEAVAAMGDVSPFFARAGMRELRRGPEPKAAALSLGLGRRGVCVHRLIEREYAARVALRPGVMARVRAWARGQASTRGISAGPGWVLLASLAARALEGSIAYVAQRGVYHTGGTDGKEGKHICTPLHGSRAAQDRRRVAGLAPRELRDRSAGHPADRGPRRAL